MSRVAATALLLASSFLPHSYAFYTARFGAAPYVSRQPVRQGHPSETAAAAASSADVGGRRRPSVRRSRGCGGRIRFAPHTYWGLAATATAAASTTMSADVSEGDVVVVVGASGRLGSLVTQSLASTGKYKVRGLVRNVDKAKEALGLSSADDGLEIEVMQGNISDEASLGPAMKGASCVVACTGTTAFPSKLWTGGNTPDAVDNLAVGNLLRAAEAGGNLKRFILLSSVGVTRGDKFPFFILNAFGVLDAKAKGEARVRKAAEEGGFSYSIVRPGQVQGEPFLTYSKAKGATLSPDVPEKGSTKRMVSVKQGDSEAGDVNPSSVAEAFTQAVSQPAAAGKSYTVVDKLGDIPTQETWDEIFAQL